MADLLSLGTQGVLAAQRQLSTTGHNISNVNTDGYSRQVVEQGTNESQYWGGQRFGSGVHIADVRRNYDKFAVNELNLATSSLGHASKLNSQLSMLDSLLSQSAKKIPDNMNELYASLEGLADTPNDMGARKVVLENAKMVADSFNDINNTLRLQESDTAAEIEGTVQRLNNIGKELVDINQALVKSNGTDNDLLDRHQNLINELSEYTQVTVNTRKDGLFNVLIGTGNTLVSGLHASELTTVPGDPDHQQRRLALKTGESVKPISNDDINGQLGALFEFRDTTLANSRDQLGMMATGLAMKFNELQSQGFDLSGEVGANFFNNLNDPDIARNRVVKSSDSTADLSVFIDDVSQLRAGDYHLKFDGTQYTLIDPDDKQTQVNPTGTPATFNIDGLNIQIDSPLSSGERVILRPMRDSAGQVYVDMEDPAKIAAQSYISPTSKIDGNADLKVISQGAQQEFEVIISADASQFTVLDFDGNILQGPQVYPPVGPFTVNGTTLELSEGAAKDDRFVVSLLPADGDNGNLLRMQDLQTDKIMNDGRSTLIDVFEGLTSDIGTQKASFARLESISRTELDAAEGRVAEISGVNLDEEAANMMKFQQAYMASSRIMTAANEAFQTLLSATR